MKQDHNISDEREWKKVIEILYALVAEMKLLFETPKTRG
jgi:hypothetical protein